MKRLLIALLLFPVAAYAQTTPVYQGSQSVTPGHVAQWTTNGVVQDGGSAANGSLTNVGIVGPGLPFCINDASPTSPSGYHQFCLGANTLGGGLLSYNAFGGAAALPLQVNINGVTSPLSGGGGSGALPNGELFVGSNLNVATAQPVSGDATMINTGALSITGLTHVTNGTLANTGLANSTITIAGQTVALGGSANISCANLSNGATGCSTATGTSGATIPTNSGGFTQSGLANFTGGLEVNGSAISPFALSSLVAQAANTVVANATSASASPTAVAVPSCGNSNNALSWTAGAGFGCNTISSSGTPGGTTSDIQFNSSSVFTGNSGLTYDGTSVLGVGTAGTSAGAVAFSNATSGSVTLTVPTGALGTVTDILPLGGTILTTTSTNLPLTSLATQAANTIVGNGTASSAAPTALAIPSCAGTADALSWTSGTGFGCNAITSSGSPGGASGNVQFNSSGAYAGNSGFTYDGTSVLGLGVSGTSVGGVGFNNATSGTITLVPPTGALGTGTVVLPLSGTLVATGANTFTGVQTLNGGLRYNRRTITGTTATDTAGANDLVINWNSTAAGTKTESIPACASGIDGQVYIIKDEEVNAYTLPITITPATGTIEKAATYSANVNAGSWTLVCDASTTNWTVN